MSEEIKSTHWKKLFNPVYLGSWDLVKGQDQNGKPVYSEVNVTIESIKSEKVEIQGKKQDAILIRFIGKAKPMILKPENSKLITKVLGTPIYENWIGKTITLHVVMVSAFNEMIDAIRVKWSR